MNLRVFLCLFVLLGLVLARPHVAAAQVAAPPPQGVAVLGTANAKDDAFALARSVYASGLRPRTLDEMRARILAGEQPTMGTKELKDLSDLRGAINGEDVASKRLLASIAAQFNLQAILVVSEKPAAAPAAAVDADGGAPDSTSDAGAPVGTTPYARLFVAALGDFDAARYDPAAPSDGGWNATVASVVGRFPPPPPPPAGVALPPPQLAKIPQEKHEDKPFYKSPWLWGALAAAAVIGGIFFFASQDKSSDPIHVRMTVP